MTSRDRERHGAVGWAHAALRGFAEPRLTPWREIALMTVVVAAVVLAVVLRR
jgi:hypothetical protein